ncbi:MAG: CotH kinase family protein [Polyangiales bacterium]
MGAATKSDTQTWLSVVGTLAWLTLAGCGGHPSERPAPGDDRDASSDESPDASRTEDAAVSGNKPGDAGAGDAAALDDAAVPDAGPDAQPPGNQEPHGPVDPPPEPPDAGGPLPDVPPCQPTAGGPYTLLEGEQLTVVVTCRTGTPPPLELSVQPLPTGASYDAAGALLYWRPGPDQAAKYSLGLQVRTSAGSETATVEVIVVDRWDAADNVPVRDPSTYSEEYGLPVLHLTTDPGVNDNEYTPATIVYRGHTYSGAQAKYRGATSSFYPKRSYTLKFTKEDKFDEPTFAGGFHQKRKVTLITPFDDNSYLRHRLGFTLWNQLDPAHIQVQSYNVVVFLNGEYYGLYTLADHINGYLMEDHGFDQEGNLYKARSHDANFRPTSFERRDAEGVEPPKNGPHDGYTKEEGLPIEGEPKAYDDLDAFLTWTWSSTAEQFAQEIDQQIARKEYEDWWIWASFIRADDSVGKNSYHYHDPKIADSVWHFVPWDLNQSFGQDYLTQRTLAADNAPEWYYLDMNGLFERMLADPTLGAAMRARYRAELAGSYAVAPLQAQLDAMAAEIHASALRDEQKWGGTYRSFDWWSGRTNFLTHEQEVAYLRQWISDRHAFLALQYP